MSQKYHHGTIRKYTSALLNVFGNTEVQYNLSDGSLVTKKIPVAYSNREKSEILLQLSEDGILSGNYNILPHGYLSMTSLDRAIERTQNKNMKINPLRTEKEISYTYNSVPWDFDYDLVFICRGMNEATQIIEQIAPIFNLNYYIDIHEVENLSQATRVPIKLNGVQLESEEYDFDSSNVVTITFNLQVVGNLYPPTKLTPRIKEFNLQLNQIIDNNEALRTSLQEFDVDFNGNTE